MLLLFIYWNYSTEFYGQNNILDEYWQLESMSCAEFKMLAMSSVSTPLLDLRHCSCSTYSAVVVTAIVLNFISSPWFISLCAFYICIISHRITSLLYHTTPQLMAPSKSQALYFVAVLQTSSPPSLLFTTLSSPPLFSSPEEMLALFVSKSVIYVVFRFQKSYSVQSGTILCMREKERGQWWHSGLLLHCFTLC